jgi:transcriptional regulator with XRE-family HTH domain
MCHFEVNNNYFVLYLTNILIYIQNETKGAIMQKNIAVTGMTSTIDELKRLRKRAKISQRDIAAAIHKSSRDISRIENRHISLSYESACHIIAYLYSRDVISGGDWIGLLQTFFADTFDIFSASLNPAEARTQTLTKEQKKFDLLVKIGDGLYAIADFKVVSAEHINQIIEDRKKEIIKNLETVSPSAYGKIQEMLKNLPSMKRENNR